MRKSRMVMIGAGWWGVEIYVPVMINHPDIELVAVNRRDQTALDQILDKFDIPRGYTDYKEMLANEKPDAVIITSPHILHYEHAKAALEAGAHVLIDKPMTTNAKDARALVDLAKKMGKEIIIPYGWNYKDFVTKASKLIASGRIGEVRNISCQLATFTYDLFGGEGLIEAKDHMFQPQKSTWADPDKAGGYGWGQLSHSLGLLFRLVDLAPKNIYAVDVKSAVNVDLCDSAILTFENGAIASISGSALLPKHCSYQLDIKIFGSEGMLIMDMERTRMELRRFDKDDIVLDLKADEGQYMVEEPISRLVDICNETATDIEANGIVGMRAIEVLDAMYRSIKSGKLEAV